GAVMGNTTVLAALTLGDNLHRPPSLPHGLHQYGNQGLAHAAADVTVLHQVHGTLGICTICTGGPVEVGEHFRQAVTAHAVIPQHDGKVVTIETRTRCLRVPLSPGMAAVEGAAGIEADPVTTFILARQSEILV